MKSRTLSLAIFSVLLGVAAGFASYAKSKQAKILVYYQIPGQLVSSTLTEPCPWGNKRCQILVQHLYAVSLYKDSLLIQPVTSINDSPKSVH